MTGHRKASFSLADGGSALWYGTLQQALARSDQGPPAGGTRSRLRGATPERALASAFPDTVDEVGWAVGRYQVQA